MSWARFKIIAKIFIVGTILMPLYFYYTSVTMNPCDKIQANVCHVANHCALSEVNQCEQISIWKYIGNKLPYMDVVNSLR